MDDQVYIGAYRHFRSELRQIEPFGEPMTYDWIRLPDSISGGGMAYFQMLEEHALELANVINQFLTDIEKLCAWEKVILEYQEEERLYILHEFVRPLCTLCLNLPYALRSRFIFSVTHLSHQANMAVLGDKWQDNLPPDDKIDTEQMDQFASQWKSYKKLKLTMERLSDKKYQSEVDHYRNKYQHRFPSHIEFGLSEMVTRGVENNGKVIYSLGYKKPLQIKDIIVALKKQHGIALKCCVCYKRLINEQIEKIRIT